MSTKNIRSLWLILAMTGVFSATLLADNKPSYTEDFSGVQDGTRLTEIKGWALCSGTDNSGVVSLASGYRGAGLRVTRNDKYQKTLEAAQIASLEGRGAEFRCKIRIVTPAYARINLLVGQGDGVHGINLMFFGGNVGDAKENYVRICNGGTDWGRGESIDLTEAKWSKEVWYEIIISNIHKTETNTVEGNLSIVEAGGSEHALIRDQVIRSRGTAAGFKKIDTVIVGNGGTNRTFDADDFTLSAGE